MKKFNRSHLILFAAACALVCSVFAQIPPTEYQWNVTLRVVDEAGNPIGGAAADIQYFENSHLANAEGATDTNGFFAASHSVSLRVLGIDLGINAKADGYYMTQSAVHLLLPYDVSKWNPTVTLVLKKVVRPIPMYAKYQHSEPKVFKKTGRSPIAFTNTVGYDLMLGDWVMPYGKGVKSDMIFTEEFDKKSQTDFSFRLTVSFPNPDDGIQEFTVPENGLGSALRSPHEAPSDGYQPQLIRENYHHPDGTGMADYDPNRNYFFRVRTVRDSNGKIKSALYGKIYGDPEQVNFWYYLNPTPNDRNIEFDPNHNLLTGGDVSRP